jgi:hypothetical protein
MIARVKPLLLSVSFDFRDIFKTGAKLIMDHGCHDLKSGQIGILCRLRHGLSRPGPGPLDKLPTKLKRQQMCISPAACAAAQASLLIALDQVLPGCEPVEHW